MECAFAKLYRELPGFHAYLSFNGMPTNTRFGEDNSRLNRRIADHDEVDPSQRESAFFAAASRSASLSPAESAESGSTGGGIVSQTLQSSQKSHNLIAPTLQRLP